MSKFKTSDRNDQTVRLLDDAELDAVIGGGALDDCIRVQTISGAVPPVGSEFRDLFAKHTLGTYH
jgi:hypothetical protein